MIKQLLKSVLAKYRDLFVLATDKSSNFAQPRLIIDKSVLIFCILSIYIFYAVAKLIFKCTEVILEGK